MYEPVAHALLNRILDELRTQVDDADLRHFYTRLGANFYAIHSLFQMLYGDRDDFEDQMVNLVKVMAEQYIRRSDQLKLLDREREFDHEWFLTQEWVGMALYCDRFADDLKGLRALDGDQSGLVRDVFEFGADGILGVYATVFVSQLLESRDTLGVAELELLESLDL